MNQAYVAYASDRRNHRMADIVVGGISRVVDFEKMTQQNTATKKLRNIRICTGVPAQWQSSPSALLTQSPTWASFYVEVKHLDILVAVTHILRATGHIWDVKSPCACMNSAQVKSIHRIENFRLWHRYQARLKAMREEHAKCNIAVQGAQGLTQPVPGPNLF